MSKKHRSKKIAPPVYTGAPAKPAPRTLPEALGMKPEPTVIMALTNGQAEGWICNAAIQRVQGAGAMRDYIRIEDLCTVQCEEPDPGCHRVRVTVERA